MSKRMLSLVVLGCALLVGGAGNAAAQTLGAGNSSTAPGQDTAIATCTSTYTSQRLNGINGDETGSSHDSKQLHDAVTNCDHFWLPPPFAP